MRISKKLAASALALALALPVAAAPAARASATPLQAGAAAAAQPVKAVQAKKARKASIKAAKASKVKARTYTGKTARLKIKLTYKGKRLKAGRDYTLSYKDNVSAGTAKVIATGKGRFKETEVVRFRIAKARIAKAKAAKITAQAWTGNAVKVASKLTYKGKALSAGADYAVSYKNAAGPGKVTANVRGKGSFKGSKKVAYKVKDPKVAQEMIYAFNNGGCEMFASNPRTMYVGDVPEVVFGSDVEVEDPNAKVNGKPTVSLIGRAKIDDPSRGETIVMPEGLAEAIWRAEGYSGNPNYLSVWGGCLVDARKSPTSLRDFQGRFGVDVPIWFSKALYELDRKCAYWGNWSSGKEWVVKL